MSLDKILQRTAQRKALGIAAGMRVASTTPLINPAHAQSTASPKIVDCIHFGDVTGETILCPTCSGAIRLKVFRCEVHGECLPTKSISGSPIKCCKGCKDRREVVDITPPLQILQNQSDSLIGGDDVKKAIKWQYGITTVPRRRDDELPRTLHSLALAGFDKPRLFVDGCDDTRSWMNEFGLEVTPRHPPVKAYGNWLLALAELFIRDPAADRYAIFQDDIIASKNLRKYLDRCTYPVRGYWNLYTLPISTSGMKALQESPPLVSSNVTDAPEKKIQSSSSHVTSDSTSDDTSGLNGAHSDSVQIESKYQTGWYKSNQRGRSALGLVFDRDTVLTMLTNQSITVDEDRVTRTHGRNGTVDFLAYRPMDAVKGQRNIDGAVITALQRSGWTEYVHHPSLLQHTGLVSAIGNRAYPNSDSFLGAQFDLMSLLEEVSKV